MTAPTASPLAAFSTAIRDTLNNWRDTVTTIRNEVTGDRRITSTSAGEVTAERVGAIRGEWLNHVQILRAQIAAAVQTAADRATVLLPPLGAGVEWILEREARWGQWTDTLAQGPALRAPGLFRMAIDPLDVDTLAEKLPRYYLARGMDPDVVDQIAVLARHRLAELAGPAALAAADEADAYATASAGLQPMLDFLEAEINDGRAVAPLHAAVTGRLAAAAQARRLLGLPLT